MTDGRIENDAYQTPTKTIDALLQHIQLPEVPRFLEPCRGAGHIFNRVHAVERHWCEITEGVDYLSFRPAVKYDLIITNPPFSHWREFLRKSLTEADCVIYLLRLQTLGSGKRTGRKDFWNSNPPNYLFPLESRPAFVNGRTDNSDYAWFAWDRCELLPIANSWLTVL